MPRLGTLSRLRKHGNAPIPQPWKESRFLGRESNNQRRATVILAMAVVGVVRAPQPCSIYAKWGQTRLSVFCGVVAERAGHDIGKTESGVRHHFLTHFFSSLSPAVRSVNGKLRCSGGSAARPAPPILYGFACAWRSALHAFTGRPKA